MADRRREIGERIRDLRQTQGLTQEALAERCGVHGGGVVSRWETGSQVPRLDMAAEIATALGVPLSALVERMEAVEPSARPLEAQAVEWLRQLDDEHLAAVAPMLQRLADLSDRTR